MNRAPENRDSAGVRFPPPLAFVLPLGAAFLMHRFWPLPILDPAGAGWLRVTGVLLTLNGLALDLAGLYVFWRHRTSPLPMRPSSTVVTVGPYAFTRNPMYVGMTAIYLGVTLWGNSLWPLPFLPLSLLIIRRYVIAREERYMEAKFGDAYRAYRDRVRRWL